MCRLTFVGLKKYVVPCEGMRACGEAGKLKIDNCIES